VTHRSLLTAVTAGFLVLGTAPVLAQTPAPMERALIAADRLEIMELSAQFDNSLDSEDAQAFAATFTPDGALDGFWGSAEGTEQILAAHAFMLSTFSKDKRHVVTNHQIAVNGDQATMYCYLSVFDRLTLAVTGTSTFRDELVRTPQGWRFARRTLTADPNVQPIIDSLRAMGS
jgi:uncharacterized protein (TIGR02246 family)